MWPSGAAAITSRAPIAVEAPGLFSTITAEPSDSPILCAMARASMSVCPPGGNGTTMRTGLPGSGNDWRCGGKGEQPAERNEADFHGHLLRGLVYILRAMPARYPERIVCLTEETTETLYLLGEERRIVGISGYTVRPPRARKEKPRVSAFLSAKTEKILELKPDLVLGFSDLQADIARDLAKAGLNVMIFNQRSVDEILSMIQTLSSIVGAAGQGRAAGRGTGGQPRSDQKKRSKPSPGRPKVYFEEWDEPMISGIRWVSELVEIAGGEDVFSELSSFPGGRRTHLATGRRWSRASPT